MSLIRDDKVYFEESNSSYPQNYCIISFISPEASIKKKLINDISKFLYFELKKKINEIVTSMLNEMNIYIKNIIDDQTSMFKDLNNELKRELQFNVESSSKKYIDEYQFTNSELYDIISEIKFDDIQSDNVYGIKVCGVFATLQEANKYAIDSKKKYEPNVNRFVHHIGCWCPFDPFEKCIKDKTYDATENTNPRTAGEVQFNSIVESYNDNVQQKDNFLLQQKQYETNTEDIENKLKKEMNEKLKSNIAKLKEARKSKKYSTKN